MPGEFRSVALGQEALQAQRLDLSNRGLSVLPPEIGRLTNLEHLDLTGNQLTSLPPEIGRLTNLRTLDLGRNRLTAFPSPVLELSNLEAVGFTENQLTILPPQIGQLINLQALYLGGNEVSSLPAEIGQLIHLKVLRLSRNQLSTLPPEIGQLTNLQALDLGDNQLTSLAPAIGQLSNLHTLNLGGNNLTELPAEIGRLSSLQVLHLSHNELGALPAEMAGMVARGLWLDASGNPLQEMFPGLLERGDALAAYLHSLTDAQAQYECKVILVGEGNVGKSSLVAALQGQPFVEGRPTTHGIDTQLLPLSHPRLGLPMRVQAWDFGGQEVYRITHQFFFSAQALYLVVWSAREGQEQNEIEGWLRRIRLRVGHDAPTLVVATHSDERVPELDYPRLQQAFPGMLLGHHEVDNRSGNGIPALGEAVAEQAARLPQMGQLLSPRWAAARDDILARTNTEPQVSYERFVAICQGHGMDEEEVATLAGLLHDQGQVIYYGEDEGLRDIIVLNPEWLTKAISYVLKDKPTREQGGVLDHARLREIWGHRHNGAAYPARHYPYFLRLMEKFDVSYRLRDDEYRSLVAQLVPYERPNLPWDRHTPLPKGIRALALECQLSEPAPGLIAWLTVRLHRASTGRHWRSGVFLRYPIDAYNSEALLELGDDRHLAVEVHAPSPDMFFNVLRDSVEDLIIRRWPGLDYQLLIPCPTQNADGSACSGRFKLTTLLRFWERGKTDVDCQECFERYDIGRLLTGFTVPPTPLQSGLERVQEQLSGITSDVEEIKRYAAATADSVRRVLKAVSVEVTDCPRLFTLTREEPAGMGRLRLGEDHYLLTLWCEQPDHWHPWPDASYHLRQPKDWLVRIGPYAALVVRTLQTVVPVVGAVAGMTLTEDQLKQTKHELELMKTLVAKLPVNLGPERHELEPLQPHGQLAPSAGESLRSLRQLLFKEDPARLFGGLRRVPAPSGEFLWVCTTHYVEHDPGLPSIPGK
jgi:Leucine-rich repeat (LRR) protein